MENDYLNGNIEKEFNSFLDHLRSLEKKTAAFSKSKEAYFNEEWHKKKIVLQELKQIDYRNPLTQIHESYMKEKYSDFLLSQELKLMESLFGVTSLEKLGEKQEKLGFVKKILDVFLDHYISKHFASIISSLNKLQFLEKNVVSSLDICQSTRAKQALFKSKILETQAKYLFAKQKQANLNFIYYMIVSTLSLYKKKLNELKDLGHLSNLVYENLSDISADLKERTIEIRKATSKSTKHSFLALENVERIVNEKIQSVMQSMEKFSSMIFEGINLRKYKDYFILYVSISKKKTDMFINVNQCLLNVLELIH